MLSLVTTFAAGSYVHPVSEISSTVNVKTVPLGGLFTLSESNATSPIAPVKPESVSLVASLQ
jgi:hypothetical protein